MTVEYGGNIGRVLRRALMPAMAIGLVLWTAYEFHKGSISPYIASICGSVSGADTITSVYESLKN